MTGDTSEYNSYVVRKAERKHGGQRRESIVCGDAKTLYSAIREDDDRVDSFYIFLNDRRDIGFVPFVVIDTTAISESRGIQYTHCDTVLAFKFIRLRMLGLTLIFPSVSFVPLIMPEFKLVGTPPCQYVRK